jgi:hypothetical protein
VLRLVRDVDDPMTTETGQAAMDARWASSVIAVLWRGPAWRSRVPRAGHWQRARGPGIKTRRVRRGREQAMVRPSAVT